MEIRDLRSFLVIAKECNLTKAAQLLHVTQPALSRQLSALENELGIKLFRRGSRKLTLTDEGLLFRRRAEEIIDLVSKVEVEFQHPFSDISGDIYIGSGETEQLGFLVDIMRDMRENYPKVRFNIFSGASNDVAERLNSGLLDFGIFIEPASVNSYAFLRLPTMDRWGVLTLKSSQIAEKVSVKPEDLWDEPLIISKQKYVEGALASWLQRDMDQLQIVGTYTLLYNASVMAAKGMGHALGLEHLINTSGDSDLCFIPFDPPLYASVYFAWKKQKTRLLSRQAALFLKKVKSAINSKAVK